MNRVCCVYFTPTGGTKRVATAVAAAMAEELKLRLYKALLNRDLDSAIEQTHAIMDTAIDQISFYGA